jgi:alpha-acetolactate decarboxylase
MVLVALALAVGAMAAGEGTLVQYGTMREAIGQKQSQGRVALADLAGKEHFYGVGALEGLKGEVTFMDSQPTVTGVTDDGKLAGMDGAALQATMLAGASVPAWRERAIETDTPPADFDRVVRDAAVAAGMDAAKPFVFALEGEFTDVRLHVIHGACPMHARMQKIELPKDQRPFEGEYGAIRGKLVGIYAEDAVGKLTHPATSTHVHLVFTDEASGATVTGHVERAGIAHGATLRLPM